MSLRTAWLVLLLVSGMSGLAPADDRGLLRRSFLGQSPPELVFQVDDWLGKAGPTSLAALKGKVVWLQFNF